MHFKFLKSLLLFSITLTLLTLPSLAFAKTKAVKKQAAKAEHIKTEPQELKEEFDQAQTVLKIEDYLNSIQTLQANFKQIDKDQNIRIGKLILSKPGRMRFDYHQNPEESIILEGEFILYYSKELGEKNYVSSASFPVEFLSQTNIDLENDASILNVYKNKKRIKIDLSITDKNSNKTQFIGLEFTKKPMSITSLILKDELDNNTILEFSDIKINEQLEPQAFDVE